MTPFVLSSEPRLSGILVRYDTFCVLVWTLTPLSVFLGQHTFLHFPLLAGGGHPFPILSSPASRSFQVFLISVEESGLTQKLYKMALHNMDTNDRYPATSPIYPAWIERPRGGSLGLEKYETVCLLVEGISGISWAVGLVGDLAKSRREDGMVTKRVIWIWTVKELG